MTCPSHAAGSRPKSALHTLECQRPADFTRLPWGRGEGRGGRAGDPLDGKCSRGKGCAASKPVLNSAPRSAATAPPPPSAQPTLPAPPGRQPVTQPPPRAPSSQDQSLGRPGRLRRTAARNPPRGKRQLLTAPQGSAPPPYRLPTAARGPRPPSSAPPAAAPGRGPRPTPGSPVHRPRPQLPRPRPALSRPSAALANRG